MKLQQVLHHLRNAEHWRWSLQLIFLQVLWCCRSWSIGIGRSELKLKLRDVNFATPPLLHPTTHWWLVLSHHSLIPTVPCCLWMLSSEMDLKKTAVILWIVLLTPLACRGAPLSHPKLSKTVQQKAKLFGLPGFLFGLWIKWSPGLGGGATSCPCLASKGSYSFPS